MRYVLIIMHTDTDWKAHGIYRSFKRACADAKQYHHAIVLPLEQML
jgi:hypothetical protein